MGGALTWRFSSRRTQASVAEAMDGAGRVRFWSGSRAILHEGIAAEAVGEGASRCQQIMDQVGRVDVQHDGPGPGPLWLGGLSFDEAHHAMGPWAGFPAARFCLPRRQIVWEDGHAVETLLVGGPPEATVADAHPAAGDDAVASGQAPASGAVQATPGVSPWTTPPSQTLGAQTPGAQTSVPTSGDAAPGQMLDGQTPWRRLVEGAQQEIRSGRLTKVVVARAEPLPPVDVRAHVLRLAATEGTTFLFEGEASFYGCTPETLVRLAGTEVSTHALAGSAASDQAGSALLASAKDVLEHELVAAFVRERLVEAGVEHVRQGSRGLRRLRHVQHLETPVQGHAQPGTHLLRLAASLHPTPAVCGTPRRRSLEWIRANEGWPRGWYAGAVGWFDATGQGELAVALRCALQSGETRHAFAGAGIVAGSEPEREWNETESKLEAMREAP